MYKLALKNVSKSFGAFKVLDNIDLDISPGESLALVGPSGTGKSVLLKCILGLIPIDSGEIWIEDKCVISAKHNHSLKYAGFFGMLFQGSALFDSLPIWKNVAFGLIYGQGMDEKKAKVLALETLEKVGLSKKIENLFPFQISGGMQKRTSLARALVMKPQMMLFDEPTTGLDPMMLGVINKLIADTIGQEKITSITVTHDMSCLAAVAQRILLLYKGGIIWQGSKDDFFQTQNPYATQFRNGAVEGPFSL